MTASDAMKAALVLAPTIRLGETLDQFKVRYSRWYREERAAALEAARYDDVRSRLEKPR